MWLMTLDTAGIFIWVFDFPGSVKTFIDIVHDIVVAGQAFIRSKKICQYIVYMCGIGVEGLACNVFMTVLAGGLTMSGDMKLA